MKLKNNQRIPNSDIMKIREAVEQTKGTNEYAKYYMEMSSLINGNWTFLGHTVPATTLDATVKIRKDKAYFVFEYPFAGLDRYEITDAVMKLMGWEV